MWCYADFVLIPRQVAEAAQEGVPRGNLSDLYPRWLGARELLLRGRDPYSAEVTREIQAGYYGRPLDPARANDPRDQQGFAYPVYVVFLLAPTVHLSFASVQIAFRWMLLALALISVPLWFRALGLRPSPVFQLVWVIAVLGSFPAVQAIKLQQLTLLVCALLAGAAAAWARGRLALAGVCLAIASIKPQLIVLPALWLIIWSLGNWRARQRLFWSFAASMLLLFGGGELMLPGWVHRFRISTASYWTYTGGGRSVLDVALGSFPGKAVAAIVVLLLIGVCWRVRRVTAREPLFAWTLALVLAATLVVIPTFATYNQLLLLPALMLMAGSFPELWRQGRMLRVLLILGALAILWPWVAAAALDLALLLFPRATVSNAAMLPLLPSLAVPLLALAAVTVSACTRLRPGGAMTSTGSP